jgi:hypothetical protein
MAIPANEVIPPAPARPHHQSFWLWVMCLTGVDYFSTLGYQPSIAFEATGLLTPLATIVLVLVTLFGALPVYSHVAARSPHGQGSIAMLERLVSGWTGKFLVLVLLGFAATDFVITKTLSAADAAKHLLDNPLWKEQMPLMAHNRLWGWLASVLNDQLWLTMLLLVLLGSMFLRGFREVIGLAVIIVAVYLLLNAIVIVSGLVYLAGHPTRLAEWFRALEQGPGHWHIQHNPLSGQGWWTILALCVLFFPKLALGLSGFETGVAVMPLIRGKADDDPRQPRGRIRNARKLLLTAALIMSVYLLGSALVTSTLIPPEALEVQRDREGKVIRSGPAVDRALAYLAHGEGRADGDWISPLFGEWFGTLYDVSTVVILWFAGASAMAGLLNLVPQYLPRYGMAPEWARAFRPLVLLFTGVNLLVTWLFDADVGAQGGAYATGVLVLMTSAGVATVIDRWRSRSGHWLRRTPWPYVLITLMFVYTTIAIIIEKPDGIMIGSCFVAAILVSSLISRTVRSTELRFDRFEFVDEASRLLWDSMRYMQLPILVPHRPGRRDLASKEESIRREHHLSPDMYLVFIEAELGDVSEFLQRPLMEIDQEEGRFIIRITRCASIAHVIATVGLEMSKEGKPPEIHFGWSDEDSLAANIRFVLFGEGNVPWMVRELIRKAEPNPDRQPRVIIG